MPTNNRRLPKSFYFSSQYKSPSHRNEDRLGQIDFRTFDPFVPESRQTVANCKKHRRQRHELSDKCKHVLAVVDAQERLLSTRPEAQQSAGYSAQGSPMRKPEISIEFGDGIPEIAKEYVKFWIEQSGMVREPYSRQYDVHNIKDEHNHAEKPSIVLMAPFIETDITDENQLTVAIKTFFENPQAFASKGKVGNLRIYSINKKTHEEDAVGYSQQLPIKIIGKEIISKNLQKATYKPGYTRGEPVKNLDKKTKDLQDAVDIHARKIERLKDELKFAEDHPEDSPRDLERIEEELNREELSQNDRWDKLQYMVDEPARRDIARDKRKLKAEMDGRENYKQKQEYNRKQRSILFNMLNPANNIAPNRMGGGTNPIGYALQAAETVPTIANNLIAGIVGRKIAQKEHDEKEEYENRLKEIEAREYALHQKESDFGEPQDAPTLNQPEDSVSEEKEELHIFNEQDKNRNEYLSSSIEPKPPMGPGNMVRNIGMMANRQPKNPKAKNDQTESFSQDSVQTDVGKSLNTSELMIIARLKKGGI